MPEKIPYYDDKFRVIFDNSPMAILLVKDRINVDINSAFTKLTGYDKSEVVGKSARMFYRSMDDYLRMGEDIYGHLEKNEKYVVEYNMMPKDGSDLFIEMNLSKLPDDTVLLMVRDITDRVLLNKERQSSLERMRQLAGATFEGIVVHVNSIIREINDQLLDLLDYKREEVIGRPILDFIAKESHEDVIRSVKEKNEKPYEVKLVHKNGNKIITEIRGKKIIYDGEEARVTVLRDISERKEAELILAKSEEKYRTLFEQSSDAQLIIDNGKFVDYNHAAIKMLRYANKEKLLSTHPSQLSPPFQPDGRHSYEKSIEMMNLALKRGNLRFEWIHKRADGELFPVEVLLTAVPSDGKNILYCVWRDITGIKEAEKEIRDSESKYRHLLDNIPLKVFYKDKNGTYLAVNPSFAADRHLKPIDFEGKTDFDLFPKDKAKKYHEDDLKVMKGGKTVQSEASYQHENKDKIINIIKVPVRDESGNVSGILGIFWDISERKHAENELRKSLQIKQIAEAIANMGSWEWDIPANEVTFSKNAMKMHKVDEKNFDGKFESLIPLVYPEDRLKFQKSIEKILLEKETFPFEYRVQPETGEIRIFSETNKIYLDKNGEIQRLVGIISDITEQRKFEEMLRKQSLMVDTITDGIIIADLEGVISDWNRGAEQMYGYSRDEAIGQTAEIVHYPKDTPSQIPEMVQSILKEGRWSGELMFERKDGTVGHSETVVVPILDNDFFPIATIGINREITDRKIVENELKLSKLRLQSLFDLSQMQVENENELIHHGLEEAVVITDSKIGYFHLYNEEEKSLCLTAWSDSTKVLCTAEKTPHYNLSEAGVWADCIRQRKPVIHNEYSNMDDKKGYPEGHFPVIRHMSVPIFDNDKIIAVSGVGNKIDYYDENDANQLLLFMNNLWRIIKQNRADEEMKRLNSELKRSNNELEQFAYITSHDLQEPLRSIVGFLQLLEDQHKDKLDEKGIHFINRSIAASKRMSDMIQSILLYSRVGRSSEPFEKFNLDLALDDAIANLHKKISDSSTIIKRTKLPDVVGNRILLTHLMQNLIDNGIKFNNSDAPEINITVEEDETHWLISFKDNGIGFEEKFKNRIFEIFQRLHTITEYSGTGIGLALCKKIVERHSGEIQVESEPQEGSNFIFSLIKEQQ